LLFSVLDTAGSMAMANAVAWRQLVEFNSVLVDVALSE
jgi:hypothetical protein